MAESARDGNNPESALLYFAEKVECRTRRCPVSGREFTVIGNSAGEFCFNGLGRGRSLSLKLKPVGDFRACPELCTNYLVRANAGGVLLVAVAARGGRAARAPFKPRLNTEKNRLRLVPAPHPGQMRSFVFEARASLIGAGGKTLEACTAYLWTHCVAVEGESGPEPAFEAPGGARNAPQPQAAPGRAYSQACAELGKRLYETQTLPEPETGDEQIYRAEADFRQEEDPCALRPPEKLQ